MVIVVEEGPECFHDTLVEGVQIPVVLTALECMGEVLDVDEGAGVAKLGSDTPVDVVLGDGSSSQAGACWDVELHDVFPTVVGVALASYMAEGIVSYSSHPATLSLQSSSSSIYICDGPRQFT